MERIKLPDQIVRRIQREAPTHDISENYGRRGGYFGDYDDSAAGYKSVCIYVQNGLAEHLDLFKEIVRGIFKIQSNNQRMYPLIIFGFGSSNHLQHEKKFFDFGYMNDSLNDIKVAETIARISGSTLYNPAIIPEMFPQTDSRSLFTGKTRIDREDLLVIIGLENEVFLSETLKDKITDSLKKHILLVEIGKEEILFKTKDITFEYKPQIN
jgi:hypothetical protein